MSEQKKGFGAKILIFKLQNDHLDCSINQYCADTLTGIFERFFIQSCLKTSKVLAPKQNNKTNLNWKIMAFYGTNMAPINLEHFLVVQINTDVH